MVEVYNKNFDTLDVGLILVNHGLGVVAIPLMLKAAPREELNKC